MAQAATLVSIHGLTAGEWDVPEDDGAEWEGLSPPEPTAPATDGQLPGSEYHREWAHVEKIVSLSTKVSALTAADAIAMDILETATKSLPAICARLAAQAVTPFGTQRDTDQEAGPGMAPGLCKPLMQVRGFSVTAFIQNRGCNVSAHHRITFC